MSQLPQDAPVVLQAIAHLAHHLQIETAEIAVLRAEAVTWPDSSLGCPQPGMNYMQVLTRGFFIQLRARGEVYRYHAGARRPPFLCTAPDAQAPVSGNDLTI